MADQIVTTQTATAERIGEVAFDLVSLYTILGFAQDALADCDDYGQTDTPHGALMSNVGQILIDTRQRLQQYADQLCRIQNEVEGVTV